MSFSIGRHRIGLDQPPFIIAEMSGNHKGSLDRALQIVEAVAKAGVQALKLQTYTADTMTLDIREGAFYISDADSLWKGHSLYELYQQAYTPWEWHKTIFERCHELGLIGFSTPFDISAVDFLETLNVPCYKIASFELVDLPLIRRAAKTGKPMIMSTGMATLAEIEEAVAAARGGGCRELILLKCTSSYPADPSDANVMTIPDLRKRFGCEVGVSDHTISLGVSLAAVAQGATVIERHVTLARDDGAVDSAFSTTPPELQQLMAEAQNVQKALGGVSYGAKSHEKSSLKYRRSLYVVRDLNAGEPLTPENVRSVRPALGLAPKHYDQILGKKAARALKRGTALAEDMIEGGLPCA